MRELNKKITLACEVLKLSARITNNSVTDVFCEFSAHVNCLSVRVLLNGWNSEYKKPDYYKIIYLDRADVKDLEELTMYLKELERKVA